MKDAYARIADRAMQANKTGAKTHREVIALLKTVLQSVGGPLSPEESQSFTGYAEPDYDTAVLRARMSLASSVTSLEQTRISFLTRMRESTKVYRAVHRVNKLVGRVLQTDVQEPETDGIYSASFAGLTQQYASQLKDALDHRVINPIVKNAL